MIDSLKPREGVDPKQLSIAESGAFPAGCNPFRALYAVDAGPHARCRAGITPACSISLIDSTVNSELGVLPAITTIRIESLFLGPLVTFWKRRMTPGGNEIRSRGFSSTCSSLPLPFSQLARQVPVMAMKVSLVSWLWSIGPLPGLARQ